jgi:hypothetical protein
MPGFPTQTVGTPTNRGKARRYTGKGIGLEQDGEINSPLQKREGSKRQDGALKGRRYKRRGQPGSSPAAEAEEDALEAVAPGTACRAPTGALAAAGMFGCRAKNPGNGQKG